MPQSRKRRRRLHRNPGGSRSGILKRKARPLAGERLEKRLLLTAITNVDPMAFSQNASVTSNISVTFDQPINAGTANAQTRLRNV